MAKTTTKSKQAAVQKQPKTIKVSTLIIAVAVVAGLILSFYAGTAVANSYNATVQAKAVELTKEFELKDQQ